MGYLPLTNGHVMYYETHGNPRGAVAVVLHGGPGGGLSRMQLEFFNLRKWHVILYDQRGCGRSTPYGVDSLANNTTQDLISDMELLRKHIGADTWFLLGGSWGSTLALLYGEAYPKAVSGMLLRSVCLSEGYESKWMYQHDGAALVFPEAWARFTSVLPPADRGKSWRTITRRYRKQLTHRNKTVRHRAAAAWSRWEDEILKLIPTPSKRADKDSIAILENHYFTHNSFIRPGSILRRAGRLRNIPITVFHGRYDMICPFTSANKLKVVLPHIELVEVPDGGHTGFSESVKKHIKDVISELVAE
jgi:proline iminopeptidase